MRDPLTASRCLAALRTRLDTRAAGAWALSLGRLELLAFEPASDLPGEVARGFADATRSVDLDRVELAIAQAASTGQVVVSIAAGLPPDVGSGFWLRAFGATRSVAVPILGPSREVDLVVSVALGPLPDAEAVAAAVRAEVESARQAGRPAS